MPLRDHFHPPVKMLLEWDSLHSGWASNITEALNTEWLPPEFVAKEHRYGEGRLEIEVRVFNTDLGNHLVAAIELISPGNKDRPDVRRAFAAKCAAYLQQGVSLVIVDVVTERRANLHNEIVRLMEARDEHLMPADISLYAVAYRPVLRKEKAEIDLWPAPLGVGEALPTLPLRLIRDLFVPVELEMTYTETCRKRRLV